MMKDKEWLKEEVKEALHNSKKNGINYFDYLGLKNNLYELIDQLDEPKYEAVENDIPSNFKEFDINNISVDEKTGLFYFPPVSKKAIYLSSEGRSLNELYTIASRLNKLAYDNELDVILKVEG